jgi:hypothetical protein
LFVALGLGLFVYGAMLVIAIQSGAWFRPGLLEIKEG